MTRFKYLLFLLFFATNSFAQKDFLILSNSIESKTTDRTYSLIHTDSTQFAVMRFDKAIQYAETEIYDKNLKYKKTFVTTPQKRRYGGILKFEERLYMLYSRYRENKQLETFVDVSLWITPINTDSFCLTNDSMALVEPFEMKKALYRGNFVLSPDRSKILVYDYEEEGDIEEVPGLTNEITLRVYDNQFKLLWIKKVNLSPNPSGKRLIAIKKLRINNRGEVAILTDLFRNHRAYSLKEVTADPTLFFVGAAQNEFARFTPNLGNLFYNQIDFMYDKDGNIIWFGFYSNRKYYQQAGYFYIKLNSNLTKVLFKKITPFDEVLLKQILNKKKIKDEELRNFELMQFRLNKDGDLIVVAEYQPYGVNNFKSHDLLILYFESTGNLKWSKHLYKYNSYPHELDVFLKHYLMIDEGNLYLLFNRGIYKDGKAVVVKIDKDGKTEEKEILNYLNSDTVMCPTLSYPMTNGELFISLQSLFFKFHQYGVLNVRKLFEEK